MGVDAVDAVGRVDVLDQSHLVAGGSSLTGGNGGVSKEELPDLMIVSYIRNIEVRMNLLCTICCHTWP